METLEKKKKDFVHSFTFKVMIIGVLSLLMLIPNAMIQNLILERQARSKETVKKINEQWSGSQTICAPLLCVPYETIIEKRREHHIFYITPEQVNIKVNLNPEIRHFSIYKTILYKSDIQISGNFGKIDEDKHSVLNLQWNRAFLALGLSDFRGVTSNVDFSINNNKYEVEPSANQLVIGKALILNLEEEALKNAFVFNCDINLNGSSYIEFVPVGKTTQVEISGKWNAPGFTGAFSPEHNITNENFQAKWSVMYFNRDIPEFWEDKKVTTSQLEATSFGVNLVNQVDHYQQNMRSSKYAFMFIALTFVVFLFVEILTKKRINPIQYLLVGIAIILFYSLLLSISEQINFGIAYLIASSATIGLVTAYSHSIFKNKVQALTLFGILCGLYLFLFVTLQLEEIALLIGSIGLFLILGVIMYLSRKIGLNENRE